jgi:hypothetical protein
MREDMLDQQKLLFQLLDSAVEKHRFQAKQLKLLNYSFRILTLILAAASTVLLGLNIPDDPGYLVWSRNLALVFGAVSAFVVGLSAFWNLETYWLRSKVLFARVLALREWCQFRQANSGALSSKEITQAFDEYRALMYGQIEYWEKLVEQALSQTKPPPSPQQPENIA